MKRTSAQGSRASWTPLAVVAPLAAAIFLGSVGFAASARTTDIVAATPVANVQLVASSTPVARSAKTVTPVRAPKSAARAKPQRQTAPPVHAVTRASGA